MSTRATRFPRTERRNFSLSFPHESPTEEILQKVCLIASRRGFTLQEKVNDHLFIFTKIASIGGKVHLTVFEDELACCGALITNWR